MFEELYGIGTAGSGLEQFQNGVQIRLLKRDGRVHVMIDVDEDATQDDLRSIIPLACQWRDGVMEYQGAWDRGGRNEFLMHLSLMHEKGHGPANIAERINNNLEKLVNEYLVYRQEVDECHPDLIAEHDKDIFFSVFWLGMKSHPFKMDLAKSILEDLDFNKEDITWILEEGLREIKKGRIYFLKNFPVSNKKISQVLRKWRKGKIYRSIQKTGKWSRRTQKISREG